MAGPAAPMWEHRSVTGTTAELLLRGGALVLGIVIFIVAVLSIIRTMVVPRATSSWLAASVSQAVVLSVRAVAATRRTFPARESVLAWAGPLIILFQMIVWLLLFLLAYGLMIFGVGTLDFGDSMRESGSSLFTLGFASINTESQTIIDFMAAATGPIVIALLIGFLPTIYSIYLDRETDVTQMSTMGGEPAWGPELLCRLSVSGAITTLPELCASWTDWTTRIRLTHVNYPMLLRVRSTRSTRNFVLALLTMGDAAALYLSLTTTKPRKEAFSLLLAGDQTLEVLFVYLHSPRTSLRNRTIEPHVNVGDVHALRTVKHLPPWNRRFLATQLASDIDILRGLDAKTVSRLRVGERGGTTLTRADFDQAVDLLRRAHFPIEVDIDEAWEQFRLARSRYEFAAFGLCHELDVTPAPWSGTRRFKTQVHWPTHVVDVLDELGDDEEPQQ